MLMAAPSVVMAQNEVLKVNQVGFTPDAEKTASIELGSVAGKVNKMSIVNADNGKTVWKGKTYRDAVSPISGKTRRVIDFSSVTSEGNYKLVVGDNSVTFSIKQHPYTELAAAGIQGFYFQRASMPIDEKYVGKWARPAGHMDTEVLVHPSAATKERPAGTVISSSKGWYDAGDYNKYIVNSGYSVGVLLSAYEMCPEYFTNLKVNIPESGNGVPDILNEVFYNIEWMMTMQDTDGGLYHKLTTPSFEAFIAPTECKQKRYVVKKTTAATLDFAASMAQAARIYKQYEAQFPGFAAKAQQQAELAYSWAKTNPKEVYDQNKMNAEFDPDVTTGAYDDTRFNDEFFWAATELYFLTGKSDYRVDALNYMPEGYSSASWGTVAGLGSMQWATKSGLSVSDNQIASIMKDKFVNYIKPFVATADSSCFQSPYGNEPKDFFWGCNSEGCARRGLEMLYAYKLTGDAVYKTSAQRTMNYMLGQNATGYCYVTGFGTKSPIHPHQRLAASNPNGAYPGFLVGGPNPGQQDKTESLVYPTKIADESYLDNTDSYASNEIAINWNATLVAFAGCLDALTY